MDILATVPPVRPEPPLTRRLWEPIRLLITTPPEAPPAGALVVQWWTNAPSTHDAGARGWHAVPTVSVPPTHHPLALLPQPPAAHPHHHHHQPHGAASPPGGSPRSPRSPFSPFPSSAGSAGASGHHHAHSAGGDAPPPPRVHAACVLPTQLGWYEATARVGCAPSGPGDGDAGAQPAAEPSEWRWGGSFGANARLCAVPPSPHVHRLMPPPTPAALEELAEAWAHLARRVAAGGPGAAAAGPPAGPRHGATAPPAAADRLTSSSIPVQVQLLDAAFVAQAAALCGGGGAGGGSGTPTAAAGSAADAASTSSSSSAHAHHQSVHSGPPAAAPHAVHHLPSSSSSSSSVHNYGAPITGRPAVELTYVAALVAAMVSHSVANTPGGRALGGGGGGGELAAPPQSPPPLSPTAAPDLSATAMRAAERGGFDGGGGGRVDDPEEAERLASRFALGELLASLPLLRGASARAKLLSRVLGLDVPAAAAALEEVGSIPLAAVQGMTTAAQRARAAAAAAAAADAARATTAAAATADSLASDRRRRRRGAAASAVAVAWPGGTRSILYPTARDDLRAATADAAAGGQPFSDSPPPCRLAAGGDLEDLLTGLSDEALESPLDSGGCAGGGAGAQALPGGGRAQRGGPRQRRGSLDSEGSARSHRSHHRSRHPGSPPGGAAATGVETSASDDDDNDDASSVASSGASSLLVGNGGEREGGAAARRGHGSDGPPSATPLAGGAARLGRRSPAPPAARPLCKPPTMTPHQRALLMLAHWASGHHWEQGALLQPYSGAAVSPPPPPSAQQQQHDSLQPLALDLLLNALQVLAPGLVHPALVLHMLQVLCTSGPKSLPRVYYARALRVLFARGTAPANAAAPLTFASGRAPVPTLAKAVVVAIHDIVHAHLAEVAAAQARARSGELPPMSPGHAALLLLPALSPLGGPAPPAVQHNTPTSSSPSASASAEAFPLPPRGVDASHAAPPSASEEPGPPPPDEQLSMMRSPLRLVAPSIHQGTVGTGRLAARRRAAVGAASSAAPATTAGVSSCQEDDGMGEATPAEQPAAPRVVPAGGALVDSELLPVQPPPCTPTRPQLLAVGDGVASADTAAALTSSATLLMASLRLPLTSPRPPTASPPLVAQRSPPHKQAQATQLPQSFGGSPRVSPRTTAGGVPTGTGTSSLQPGAQSSRPPPPPQQQQQQQPSASLSPSRPQPSQPRRRELPAAERVYLDTARVEQGFDLAILMGFIGDLLHESQAADAAAAAAAAAVAAAEAAAGAPLGAPLPGGVAPAGSGALRAHAVAGSPVGGCMPPTTNRAGGGGGQGPLSCASCGGSCAVRMSTLASTTRSAARAAAAAAGASVDESAAGAVAIGGGRHGDAAAGTHAHAPSLAAADCGGGGSGVGARRLLLLGGAVSPSPAPADSSSYAADDMERTARLSASSQALALTLPPQTIAQGRSFSLAGPATAVVVGNSSGTTSGGGPSPGSGAPSTAHESHLSAQPAHAEALLGVDTAPSVEKDAALAAARIETRRLARLAATTGEGERPAAGGVHATSTADATASQCPPSDVAPGGHIDLGYDEGGDVAPGSVAEAPHHHHHRHHQHHVVAPGALQQQAATPLAVASAAAGSVVESRLSLPPSSSSSSPSASPPAAVSSASTRLHLAELCPSADHGGPSLGLWLEATRAVATAAIALSAVPDGSDGVSAEYKATLTCALALAGSCPLLREVVLRRVLARWPTGNSDNEIALLEFLASALAATSHRADLALTRLQPLLLARVLRCLQSRHIKVARNALVLADPTRHLVDFLVDERPPLLALLRALRDNVRTHWSPLVKRASAAALVAYARGHAALLSAGDAAELLASVAPSPAPLRPLPLSLAGVPAPAVAACASPRGVADADDGDGGPEEDVHATGPSLRANPLAAAAHGPNGALHGHPPGALAAVAAAAGAGGGAPALPAGSSRDDGLQQQQQQQHQQHQPPPPPPQLRNAMAPAALSPSSPSASSSLLLGRPSLCIKTPRHTTHSRHRDDHPHDDDAHESRDEPSTVPHAGHPPPPVAVVAAEAVAAAAADTVQQQSGRVVVSAQPAAVAAAATHAAACTAPAALPAAIDGRRSAEAAGGEGGCDEQHNSPTGHRGDGSGGGGGATIPAPPPCSPHSLALPPQPAPSAAAAAATDGAHTGAWATGVEDGSSAGGRLPGSTPTPPPPVAAVTGSGAISAHPAVGAPLPYPPPRVVAVRATGGGGGTTPPFASPLAYHVHSPATEHALHSPPPPGGGPGGGSRLALPRSLYTSFAPSQAR